MSTESFRGSNVEAILDALTPAVSAAVGFPLEMRLGVLEEVRTGSPPRVVWAEREGGARMELAPFSLPEMELVDVQCIVYDVDIWGRSVAERDAIHLAISASLDDLFGPSAGSAGVVPGDPVRPGYDYSSKPSSRGPATEAAHAGSSYMVVDATLKAFAPRRLLPPAPIHSVPLEIDLADDTGNEPAIEGTQTL